MKQAQSKLGLLFLAIFAVFAIIGFVMYFTNNLSFSGQSSLEDAYEKQDQNGKPILVNIYSRWNSSSMQIQKSVFENDSLSKKINAKFIPVHVEANSPIGKELTTKYETNSIPAFIFIKSESDTTDYPESLEGLSAVGRLMAWIE